MKVLDYTTISNIAELSRKLSAIKKQLWTANRKSYNRIKNEIKEIDSIRELTRYYVMSGNEFAVERGLKTLETLEKLTLKVKIALQANPKEASDHYIDELNQLTEEIEALRVLIRLVDHDNSFFAN